MTTFSFSTGNPSNLVGGATASMTDLSGSLTDIKTFLNGGSITDTNVTAAGLTDTSLASPTNGVWRSVFATNGVIAGLTTTASYFTTNGVTASGGTSATAQGLWLAPTSGDIAVTSKTTRLRVRVPYIVNGVAPGITLTWGLYPVSAASGTGNLVLTLGTVVAGSTAAAVTPTLGSTSTATGSSFDFSTLGAGAYLLGVVGSGSQTANSIVMSQPILEIRHT